MKVGKYSFTQFLAATESDDFDNIDVTWEVWACHYVMRSMNSVAFEFHEGDCTKQAHTCPLCNFQYMLEDYKEYYFNEEKWRKDNGV